MNPQALLALSGALQSIVLIMDKMGRGEVTAEELEASVKAMNASVLELGKALAQPVGIEPTHPE